MSYIGLEPTQAGQIKLIDDIDGLGYNSGAYNGSFDGSETRFRLKVSASSITPSISLYLYLYSKNNFNFEIKNN